MTTEDRDVTDTGWSLADLPETAHRIHLRLSDNGLGSADGQMLCVVEEAGELAGAYRRWAGLARREGGRAEVEDEAADVVIAVAVLAARLGIDLESAIARKLAVVQSRPQREGAES